VRLKHAVKESWADVDVELKRRYDLIPNLVETVKSYAKHEREVLDRVVSLRNLAMQNHGSAASHAKDENALLVGLRSVFVVAEGYPQLKSDANFLALQQELALTEDRIAAARRFFNGNVRELRNLREQFPTSIVASSAGAEDVSFFELDDDKERVAPRVDVSSR
jgi:LemA protein